MQERLRGCEGGIKMRKYNVVDVLEKELEEMVRKAPNLIEDGLEVIV
jgi:RecB family endonuclease NucS